MSLFIVGYSTDRSLLQEGLLGTKCEWDRLGEGKDLLCLQGYAPSF